MSRHYPCTHLAAGHTAAAALASPVVPCDGTGCDCPCHSDTWPALKVPTPPSEQLDIFGCA
jgi:hypothetical protein